jgi:hypothetical protein
MHINNRLTHNSLHGHHAAGTPPGDKPRGYSLTRDTSRAALVMVAFALAFASVGCSSPLASRRAQVIEPGELEVAFVPYVEATAIVAAPTLPGAYPFAEASARFGLVDRVDLQIKLDPTIIPEVSLGYQLVGDPSKNELAFTITGGVKPSVFLFPGVGSAGLITTPIQAIVDVPVGETATLVGGVRVIPAVIFAGGASASGSGSAFTIAPGGFAALHFDLGPFFFRPELAMNGLIPLFTASGLQATPFAPQLGTINIAASVGIGGVIDFGKKKPEAPAIDPSTPIVPIVPVAPPAVEEPATAAPIDPAT